MKPIEQIAINAEQIEGLAKLLMSQCQACGVEVVTLVSVILEKAETIGQIADEEALK